jgi:valyl-tRNA synthetase
MALIKEIVAAARNIRAELKVEQKKKVNAYIYIGDPLVSRVASQNREAIRLLAVLSELFITNIPIDPVGFGFRAATNFDLKIPNEGAVDKQADIARVKKDIDRLTKDIASKTARLSDENFRNKAPRNIVIDLEAKLAEREAELNKLIENLTMLEL